MLPEELRHPPAPAGAGTERRSVPLRVPAAGMGGGWGVLLHGYTRLPASSQTPFSPSAPLHPPK